MKLKEKGFIKDDDIFIWADIDEISKPEIFHYLKHCEPKLDKDDMFIKVGLFWYEGHIGNAHHNNRDYRASPNLEYTMFKV